MSQTAHRALRAAAAALLAEALPHATVCQGRRRPMAAHITHQVNVAIVESLAEEDHTGSLDWRTRALFECAARDTAAATAEEAADDLLQAVHAALVDQAIGLEAPGQIELTPLGIAWHEDDADTTVAAATLSVELLHSTPAASIAA